METIIFFAPALGALLCGFGWRLTGETAAQVIATALVGLAALLSWVIFLTYDGVLEQITLLRWIESGSLSVDWAIRMDRLTAIMLVVVNTVSFIVHLYSFGYMAHDDQWREGEHYKARFFAYLSLFTFAMLGLVTADNLVQMFFGWEGVGVASYLLIGFYYRKPTANAAAMKAFIVNRVGDFGFSIGMFLLFITTDSLRFDDIFAAAPALADTTIRFLWQDWNAANLIAFMLFVGAMGKSAQLFLHTWLPDAMEGPTPVSALIHAATMVTAGVFLVCRMSPLMEYAPGALAIVTFIGAATAFYAGTVAMVQNDIKRVIAYSTCSHLGFMFVAAGVGAYSVAMFHLFTHAFFKAMLFLGAGSVIHATHHEQDMRNYGGLRKALPMTFAAMMVGTLAITGVGIPLTTIGFAGFQSKDAVIESAFAGAQYAFWLLVISAVLTSFYSWRLMFMTFFGAPRWDHGPHGHATGGHGPADAGHADGHTVPHESPRVMLVPLALLGLGAVFSGMIWYNVFFGDEERMRDWFGMEPAAVEASAEAWGVADDAGAGAGPAAEGAAEAEAEAATATADSAAPDAPGAAVAPVGAIFMLPYTPEKQAEVAARIDAKDAAHPPTTIIAAAHEVPKWVKVSPFVAMLTGLLLAYLFYIRRPDWPARLAANQRPLYLFLLNKWYFDEIFDALVVRPALWAGGFLWKKGDGAVIDGGINGLAMGVIPMLTRAAGRVQSGYIFTYAFYMVLGIAVLVTWVVLGGGN